MKKRESASDRKQQLASEGGITVKQVDMREPYGALDDLMVVVEALCPSWPPRGVFRPGRYWLL